MVICDVYSIVDAKRRSQSNYLMRKADVALDEPAYDLLGSAGDIEALVASPPQHRQWKGVEESVE